MNYAQLIHLSRVKVRSSAFFEKKAYNRYKSESNHYVLVEKITGSFLYQ